MDIENIREWISFGADVGILLITIYTFYKTFVYSRLDLVTTEYYSSNTNGNNYSITILNKKMSPVVVMGVRVIIDEKYLFTLYRGKPIIIEGYSTSTISSERYSYLKPKLQLAYNDNVVVEITTPNKKRIYLKKNKGIRYYSRKKLERMEQVSCIRNIYNDKLVPENAKYAIVIYTEGKVDTMFIFKTGTMTGNILGYNGLPKEAVNSKKTLTKYLKEWLTQYEIQFRVEEIKEIM